MNDALMRFFDLCTRFVEEVDNNPSAVSEVDKFRQGPEMRRVQEKIADRLRVPYNNITDGECWRELRKFCCCKKHTHYHTAKDQGATQDLTMK